MTDLIVPKPIPVDIPAAHVCVKIEATCADGVDDTRYERVEVCNGDVAGSVQAHIKANHSHVTVRGVDVSAEPFEW